MFLIYHEYQMITFRYLEYQVIFEVSTTKCDVVECKVDIIMLASMVQI